MKKSNKISFLYILSSVLLLGGLVFGGCYGIYLSVGLNFVRSNVSNMTQPTGAENVSFGGSVNFTSSMTGIVILSVILIVLSIFDIISLIKQVVLFKQFKMVRQSNLERKIEKKVKSKGAVVFFAILVDLLSVAGGVTGIVLNMRSYANGNSFWVLYVVDILVVVLAVVSMVLLIIKLKRVKKDNEDSKKSLAQKRKHPLNLNQDQSFDIANYDVDDIEYKLLKLKYLKSSRMISADEYNYLRDNLLNIDDDAQDGSSQE